jgi:prophage regulatory protein
MTNRLPETGFVRLNQILGNPRAKPPVLPIIPMGRTAWWDGVRAGRLPPPIKLGPRTTCWRVEDIRNLIANGYFVK